MTALDEGNGGSRDIGALRQIHLPEPAADSNGPNGCAQPLVIHLPEYPTRDSTRAYLPKDPNARPNRPASLMSKGGRSVEHNRIACVANCPTWFLPPE
jgi:hypothetical protein